MVKLVALYKRPEDAAAFDRHYREVHLPLVRQYPGLLRLEAANVVGGPAGESDLYLIAEMYFDSLDDLKAALASEPGRASGKDLTSFAKGLFSIHFAEVQP